MPSSKKKSSGKSKRTPAQADKARKAAIAEIEARLGQLPDSPATDATVANVGAPAGNVEAPAPAPTAVEAPAPAPTEAPAQGKRKGRTAKEPKPPKPARAKRVSGLDAAAQVLAGSDTPMSAKQMVEAAAVQGLWQSKSGKTPEATVYAAIIREIAAKGPDARFVKTDRGLFAARK